MASAADVACAKNAKARIAKLVRVPQVNTPTLNDAANEPKRTKPRSRWPQNHCAYPGTRIRNPAGEFDVRSGVVSAGRAAMSATPPSPRLIRPPQRLVTTGFVQLSQQLNQVPEGCQTPVSQSDAREEVVPAIAFVAEAVSF
jgi:hypothetical protein